MPPTAIATTDPSPLTWKPFVSLNESRSSHQIPRGKATTLDTVGVGETVQVVALHCGTVSAALQQMGIRPHQSLKVISRKASGAVIVACSDRSVRLGRSLAQSIEVSSST